MSSGQWRKPATILMLSLVPFMFAFPSEAHASTPLPTVGVWGDAYGSPNISDPSIVPNTTIVFDVIVSNAPTFNGYEYTLYYDPAYLQPTYIDVRTGIFTNPFIGVKDLSPGRIHLAVVNLGYPATSGDGILTQISFNVTGRGVSPLTLAASTTEPSDRSHTWTQLVLLTQEIPVTTADGHFSNVAGDEGPVADFSFTPSFPQEGQTITFNATGSYDPESNSTSSISQYRWDFGDGQAVNTTNPIVTHAYQSTQYPFPSYAGNFSALLTVVDSNSGFEGMITHLITISPPPPICPPGLVIARVPEKCPGIQIAINSIVAGGTIQISPGIYWENVFVPKSLKIIGSGANQTTLIGSIEADQSPNVTVTGLRVLTPPGGNSFGLKLFSSPYANITDNNFVGINGAKQTSNLTGIQLESSENVSLTGNSVQNETFGISIDYSQFSILRNNDLSENRFNFVVSGSYSQDIDQSNTVDGKPIFYGRVTSVAQIPLNPGFLGIMNSHDLTIERPYITDEGQGILIFNSTRVKIDSFESVSNSIGVDLVDSTSILISNSTLDGNVPCTGEKLEFTSNSVLANNTILCSAYAVNLDHSSSNLLNRNKLASGIFLAYSANNTVTENTVNGQTIISSSANNTIIGNTFASSLELISSTENRFANNDFSGGKSGTYYGVEIFNSPRNLFRENSITNMFFQVSSYHFDCPLVKIPCQYLTDYIQDIGISNSLGGRPIYYLVDRSNIRVPSNANFVGAVNSTNIAVQYTSPEYSEEITVVASRNILMENSNFTMPILAWEDQNLTITENMINVEDEGLPAIDITDSLGGLVSGNSIGRGSGFPTDIGISLVNSTAFAIRGNYVTAFYFAGIDLRGSSQNTINRDTIIGEEAGTIGIRMTELEFGSFPSTRNALTDNTIAENYIGLSADSGNTIYDNNFVNNVYQAVSDPGNTWDNGHGQGNYWSDYTGQDTNNDGVGDTLLPHLGLDNNPLMTPWTPNNLSASLTGRGSWPEFRRISLSKTPPALQTLSARVNDTGAASEWVMVVFNVTTTSGSQQLTSQELWINPASQTTVSFALPVIPGLYRVVATVMYSSDGYQKWNKGNSKAFSFQVVA